MRERTGQVYQKKGSTKWIARVSYVNSNGKRTAVQKMVSTKIEAKSLVKELIVKVDSGGRAAIDIEKLTFTDLLNYYEEHYAKPARFLNERKIEGMINLGRVKGFIRIFRPYFGGMKLRKITYGDILSYRTARLCVPTHYKTPRNVATMNRELSCLRRIFNIAVRQGWIERNPVTSGESLIDLAAERRRERILTLDEEKALLAACTGKREHIRPLLICLLDTGARIAETLKLRFNDIDFNHRLITYRALNTKTLKSRKVAMTERVWKELQALFVSTGNNSDARVFPFRYIRNSFEAACCQAGIETGRPFGITPHSLRHTAAVRLVKGQMSIQMVGRILGHQNPQTTYRYLSANNETLYEAASIFDSLQQA